MAEYQDLQGTFYSKKTKAKIHKKGKGRYEH